MADTMRIPLFKNVSETLFIPVWARAVETERSDGLIQDPYALRILDDHPEVRTIFQDGWLSQLGIAVRTRRLDRIVSQFLAKHPQGTVLSLGCGFDARSRRLDNGLAYWVDSDLPDVIEARKAYFSDSERHFSIASSALDPAWVMEIPQRGQPILAVVEGLLMYFSAEEVAGFFALLGKSFPGIEACFDVIGSRSVGKAHRHDTVSKCSAPFRWGAEEFSQLRSLYAGIELLEQQHFFDCPAYRLGWVRLVRWLKPFRQSCQIFHVRLNPA